MSKGSSRSGKSGMLLSGPYMVGLMAGQYPELDYGITLIPGPEAGAASSFVGGDGMSVIEATRQKDAAIEAFRWMTDAALMKEIAMENNGTWIQGLPPRQSCSGCRVPGEIPELCCLHRRPQSRDVGQPPRPSLRSTSR
jgi:ABC-type glycerol-3-phosphate transport system substrate-binding protein